MPEKHISYLDNMSTVQKINPLVIYDIGASVLHWMNNAKKVWPSSRYIAFEAMEASEFLFKENNVEYFCGVLSDTSGKEVDFFENVLYPGGNSYYRENAEVNPSASVVFSDEHKRKAITTSLDDAVRMMNFPLPDLIKMDIQGAEMDVLKGATETLKTCNNLILEIQHTNYNKGAPMKDEVISYVNSIGFRMHRQITETEYDADYHFVRK